MGIKIHRFDFENLPAELDALVTDQTINRLRNSVRITVDLEKKTYAKVDIAIVLCSDKKIQELNKQYLDKDSPTDVLCFPYAAAGHAGLHADIFVSVEQAYYQAQDNFRDGMPVDSATLTRELAFLAIHGVLHLAGWDDDTDGHRQQMLARQEQVLNQIRD
jgi:probable rRNA maturation factor